ncbi:glycosyltransferase family 9 protein [Chitinibacteraceae bacterium HSL-7]
MKVLLIRRDNIGDLVCTTPMLSALRARYPDATLAVLANSYNAGVLAGNPDLDEVFVYTKAKHRAAGVSKLSVYLDTLRLFWRLRRMRFDYAICVGGGWFKHAIKFARLAGARHVVSFVPEDGVLSGVDVGVPYRRTLDRHEVEDIFQLLAPLDVHGEPGPMTVVPDPAQVAAMRPHFAPLAGKRVLAVHLSAREPGRRWAAGRFAEAIRTLCARHADLGVALFWAPGASDDPRHPGDDAKAAEVGAALAGLPVVAVPTHTLAELTGALVHTDVQLLADGGALHIAAALGKPVAALFENRQEKTTRWYPWACPHRMIIAPERDISGIAVDDVVAAVEDLLTVHP